MTPIQYIDTDLLRIAFHADGPADGAGLGRHRADGCAGDRTRHGGRPRLGGENGVRDGRALAGNARALCGELWRSWSPGWVVPKAQFEQAFKAWQKTPEGVGHFIPQERSGPVVEAVLAED